MPAKRLVITSLSVLALSPLALVASGCGGSDATSSSTPATTTAQVETTTDTTSSPASEGTSVDVSLGKVKEFDVVPSLTSAPTGKVTFNVANEGKMLHELVVVPKPAGGATALATADGSADEKDALGEAPDIEAGASKSFTVDLKPGKYILLCNIPGHFAGGMWTEFTVQ